MKIKTSRTLTTTTQSSSKATSSSSTKTNCLFNCVILPTKSDSWRSMKGQTCKGGEISAIDGVASIEKCILLCDSGKVEVE